MILLSICCLFLAYAGRVGSGGLLGPPQAFLTYQHFITDYFIGGVTAGGTYFVVKDFGIAYKDVV